MRETQEHHTTKTERLITCLACGEVKPYHAKDMCARCYKHSNRVLHPRELNIIICAECGQEKPHEAHGLCKLCYRRSYAVESDRAYAEAHREEKNTKERERYAADREHQRERSKNYHTAHPERARGRKRNWRKANPQRDTANRRAWEKANRDKLRSKAQRRAAHKSGVDHTLTDQQWLDILAANHYRCVYCGKKLGPKNKPTQDHILALSKGGGYTLQNILPACLSCNSAKRDRNVPKPVQPMLI